MVSRSPMINAIIDDDGEVGDLSTIDPSLFKPAREVLPPSLLKNLGVRGPQKAPAKVPTTIRFHAEVLAGLKATGRGWQTRVNAPMREWVRKHPAR